MKVIKLQTVYHNVLARMCEEAYVKKSFSVLDVEGILRNRKTHCHTDPQVIALRGTEATLRHGGWIDILRDLLGAPGRDGDIGLGHGGFIYSARKVFDLLRTQLDKQKPIICTGHSMGAAIAQVLALMLIRDGFKVIEYVGFGCPRVFVGAQNWHGTAVYHYRYGRDIVPMLLPPGLLYRHPAKTWKVGKGHWYPNFRDHSISNYVQGV